MVLLTTCIDNCVEKWAGYAVSRRFDEDSADKIFNVLRERAREKE